MVNQDLGEHMYLSPDDVIHQRSRLGSNDLLPGSKSKRPGVYAEVMGINQLN